MLNRPCRTQGLTPKKNLRAYTLEELASLHTQIVSNLERVWEISGGSEDKLTGMIVQISQVVARGFTDTK